MLTRQTRSEFSFIPRSASTLTRLGAAIALSMGATIAWAAPPAMSAPANPVLHSFSGTDGAYPSYLLRARSGNFLGTTIEGGLYNSGTVYRMTPAGEVTTVYSFSGVDGAAPNSLYEAADGTLYGTTLQGGGGFGTVFKLTTDGQLSLLHAFNGLDGSSPSALVLADDGKFYGTTAAGGAPR
jgi:uncharacterized repeat protein (TIGR03803 family)